MRIRRLILLALLLTLTVGSGVVLTQGPFTAQIQLAFQTLGLWPYGIYANGDTPVWNSTTSRFTPTGGSGGGPAPANATYITQTPNAQLTAEQALSTLATGLMKSTTATGVVSTITSSTVGNVLTVTGANTFAFGTLSNTSYPAVCTALTGIAVTATPSLLGCVNGSAILTLTATAATFLQPVLGSAGAVGAPTFSWALEPTSGLYRAALNDLRFSVGGADIWRTVGDSITMSAAMYIGWGSSGVTSADLKEYREAARHLFQRDGANANRFSIANTYTSSTNYSAFSIDFQTLANVGLVGTRTAATGSATPLRLVAQRSSGAGTYTMIGMDTTAPYITFAPRSTESLNVQQAISDTGNIFAFSGLHTGTSGSVAWLAVTPTYNQTSGTAANTDLLVNRTETAVGSGQQFYLEAQTAGVPRFQVATNRVLSLFNAYTSSVNNEYFGADWATLSNVALVGTRTAATGTSRDLRLVAQQANGSDNYTIINLHTRSIGTPFIQMGLYSSGMTAQTSVSETGDWMRLGEGTSTATSGQSTRVAILPIYNQSSGTAANTDLLVNRTQTAVGSGTQRLLDLQVGGVSQFSVSNTGAVAALGIFTGTDFQPLANGSLALARSAWIRTAPSGPVACTSPTVTWSNGTAVFQIDVGTTCAAVTTLVVTLPSTTNGYGCAAANMSNATTVTQTAGGATTVTLTNYNKTTGVAAAWTDGDDIRVWCTAG